MSERKIKAKKYVCDELMKLLILEMKCFDNDKNSIEIFANRPYGRWLNEQNDIFAFAYSLRSSHRLTNNKNWMSQHQWQGAHKYVNDVVKMDLTALFPLFFILFEVLSEPRYAL